MKLEPIATAPKDGTFIVLWGPSGYTSTPWQCAVGRWRDNDWRVHSNDLYTDGGAPPTHWSPLPDALPPERRVYHRNEVAELLKVAPRAVGKWMDSQRLKCSVGYHLCSHEDLEAFCKEFDLDIYL